MANKEYIEREAVEKFITKGLNNPDKAKAYGYDAVEILSEIHYMDAADVVEVKRGEWINNNGKTLYVCSECGKVCPYDASADLVEYWICNFCPNCGAKMIIEEEV